MAGLSLTTREQLRAIAFLRWRLFVNSLQSVRGRLNLVSRSIAGLLIAGAGIGGAIAIALGSYAIATENKLSWLAALFWLICLFWQLFPITATTFTQSIDTTSFLRFPLSYRSYFLVRLIYGFLDIATILCLCWSLGLLIGVSVARPELSPWVFASVSLFVVFNLLLSRCIFVWIEHWLSRRRGREIIGIVFLLLVVAMQLVGPVMSPGTHRPHLTRFRSLEKFAPALAAFPPGLASTVMSEAGNGRITIAFAGFALSVAYAGAAAYLLHMRLLDQYHGENPESAGKSQNKSRDRALPRRGWQLPVFASAVSAVFEKELRYFSRSAPMFFTMIMPLVVVFALWGGRSGFTGSHSGFFFPIGTAYSLLVLNNIIYNSFGADGGGVQFFFLSPVSFRQIALAKNLAHLTVLALDVTLLWLGIHFVYQSPPFRILAFTIAWCLFSVPLNYAVGNLLSVYSPKRVDFAMFGRQRASETTILVSLVVQATGVGMGALAVFIAHYFASLWVATLILLVLSIHSIAGYCILLGRIDQIALSRREVLATELCRT